jgi:uncharacterized protein YxjI
MEILTYQKLNAGDVLEHIDGTVFEVVRIEKDVDTVKVAYNITLPGGEQVKCTQRFRSEALIPNAIRRD